MPASEMPGLSGREAGGAVAGPRALGHGSRSGTRSHGGLRRPRCPLCRPRQCPAPQVLQGGDREALPSRHRHRRGGHGHAQGGRQGPCAGAESSQRGNETVVS